MPWSLPRSRFMPVKTTSDLLGLRSDAYVVTETAELRGRRRRATSPSSSSTRSTIG